MMVIQKNDQIANEGRRGRAREEGPGAISGWPSGRLCLDFAETLENQFSKRQRESLNSYSDLVSWSKQAGIVTDTEAKRLVREGTIRPADAAAVFKRAIALRQAVYGIFSAVSGGRQPHAADLAILNAELTGALTRCGIVPTAGGFAWDWADDENALDRILWPVVQSAATLLTSGDLAKVRGCASPDCSSLFLDTSRNRSRRWCEMKTCGNQAKARRHYHRKKAAH